jgi:hypothetical protein
MPSGGAIIQYTYGFRSPVALDESVLKLDATFVGREWRNFLPMGIWSYRRSGGNAPALQSVAMPSILPQREGQPG